MRTRFDRRLGGLALALTVLLPACRRREQAAAPPPPAELTLVAVGDLMMHQDVKRAAQTHGFDALWAEVSPLLKGADVAFGNLETPIAPTSGRPGVPFVFNAPESLPEALKRAGWTWLSTANNHAYDQGPKGILETLERLDGVGLLHTGSGRTRAEAERPLILDRKGLRVALLAFTDLFNADLNGCEERPWVRPLSAELETLATVKAARAAADVVVVSVHWGEEYHHRPSPRQQEAAAALVTAGADLILGHHPHVLQPVSWVEAGGRRGLVAYSLGNFISNQDRTWRPGQPVAQGDNRDGALLKVRFTKAPGSALRTEAGVVPLWTDNSWGRPGPRMIQVHRVRSEEGLPDPLRAALEIRYPRIRGIIGEPWMPAPGAASAR